MKRFYGNDAEDPVWVDSGELKIFFKRVKPKTQEPRKRWWLDDVVV